RSHDRPGSFINAELWHFTPSLFTAVTQVCVGLLHFTTNACPPYLDKETWTRTLYLTRPSIYRSKWGVQYYNCEPAFVCACDHIYDTAQLFFLFPPGHFKKILEGYYLTLGPDYTYRTATDLNRNMNDNTKHFSPFLGDLSGKVTKTLNFWKAKFDQLRDALNLVDWDNILRNKNTDNKWEMFKNILNR
ncbi:unnamed protein product, partial [Ranitomeya imitator]